MPLCVFAFEATSPVSLSRRDEREKVDSSAGRTGIGNNKIPKGYVMGGTLDRAPIGRQPLMLTNRTAALQAAGFDGGYHREDVAHSSPPTAMDPKVAHALSSRLPLGEACVHSGKCEEESRKEDWAMPEALTPFAVSEMVARSTSGSKLPVGAHKPPQKKSALGNDNPKL